MVCAIIGLGYHVCDMISVPILCVLHQCVSLSMCLHRSPFYVCGLFCRCAVVRVELTFCCEKCVRVTCLWSVNNCSAFIWQTDHWGCVIFPTIAGAALISCTSALPVSILSVWLLLDAGSLSLHDTSTG